MSFLGFRIVDAPTQIAAPAPARQAPAPPQVAAAARPPVLALIAVACHLIAVLSFGVGLLLLLF